MTTSEFQPSRKTRIMYSLTSLGVATLAEAIAGVIALLEIQPTSVDLGFRIFLTVPTSIGFLLAIFLLRLYPLHGQRLAWI